MAGDELIDLDIALATEARAMYARLLTEEDKRKIDSLNTTEELITFLRRTVGWADAARELPPTGTSAELFSLEMERQVFREYERLYRFAQKTAKDFLIFFALRIKCLSILAGLRRLASPNALSYTDPLPPFFHTLPGYEIDGIAEARNFQELVAAGGGGIYGEPLRAMKPDPATGLPNYSDAAIMLEKRYYSVLSDFIKNRYSGPDRDGLLACVGFRAGLQNISYLMRLRRFKTPPDKAMELLLPINGVLSEKTKQAALAAATDKEALSLIIASLPDSRLRNLGIMDPDKLIRAAEALYFRKVIHGPPSLSVAYAFLILKEAECNMLMRVFVVLQYGVDPSSYI